MCLSSLAVQKTAAKSMKLSYFCARKAALQLAAEQSLHVGVARGQARRGVDSVDPDNGIAHVSAPQGAARPALPHVKVHYNLDCPGNVQGSTWT